MHAKSHNCLHNSQVTRRKRHLEVEVLALLADCPELIEVLLACSHDRVPLAGAEPEAFQDAAPLLSGHTACDVGQLTNVSAHQLHYLLTDSQTGISKQLVVLYSTKAYCHTSQTLCCMCTAYQYNVYNATAINQLAVCVEMTWDKQFGCLSVCLFCCPHVQPVVTIALTAVVNRRVDMPATEATNVRNVEYAVASTFTVAECREAHC